MMESVDITEQLKSRFHQRPINGATRHIVIWHDPEHEFQDIFDNLELEGVRCIWVHESNVFETKQLVCRTDTESDFLLYRHRAKGDLDGDWLADIELYAEHFQADYLSMLVRSIGADDTGEVRAALKEFNDFFNAKDRTEKFVSRVPNAKTKEDVAIGVFSALCNSSEATVEQVLRCYLENLAGDSQKTALSQLKKYGAKDWFATFLHHKTGYTGSLDSKDDLLAHVFLTALTCSMSPEYLSGLERYVKPEYGQFCLGIVHDWMKSQKGVGEGVLYDSCRNVEESLNLPHRFSNMETSALMDADVFPCINEVLLRSLMDSLAQGADRREEAILVLRRRKDLSWYSRVEPFFAALSAAVELQGFYRSHAEGFHIVQAKDVWDAYTQDWWKADAAYRHFCLNYEACLISSVFDLESSLDALATWVERTYVNWYLTESNRCWVNTAEKQWWQSGYIEGVSHQARFFDETVMSEFGSAKRVVVIISDALRYEVAHEFSEQLERETRGSASVLSMQATFPSVTEFGMAALLPQCSLSLSASDGRVFADGMPTDSTQAREKVLMARKEKSKAIRYQDLLGMNRQQRRDFVEGVELVYIYHDSIDCVGEKLATERKVFEGCEEAVRELCAVVKLAVADLNVSRVLITADHGFLYTRNPLTEMDKLPVNEIDGTTIEVGRRYAIAEDGAESPVMIKMNMEAIEGGSYVGLAPRECVRIKRAGGGDNYVHGGISLQEVVVPIVRFKNIRAGAKEFVDTQLATVQLLSTARRITNSLFGLDLFQKEAVGGKTLPAEYELVFTDASGNEISDVRSVHADMRSSDDRERIARANFTLKAGRKYPSSESYFLVAREKESGQLVWKEEFRIEIAFAPIDDFGW